MNGIIKTIKTVQYAQIHNAPLQNDLDDLRAIGLLSHIMSRGEGWQIRKSQLQKRFSRKNVDAGWKELVEKRFAVGFSCYINGKLDYFFAVSDLPISQESFDRLIYEQINALKEENKTVKSPKVIDHSPLVITEEITDALKVQQSNFADVPRVQHSKYSTKSTLIKKKEKKKKEKKKETTYIDEDVTSKASFEPKQIDNELIESIYNEVKNEITKRSFNSVLKKVKDKHDQGMVDNFRDYFTTALLNKITDLEVRKEKDKNELELKRTAIERRNQLLQKHTDNNISEVKLARPTYNWLDN